nr:DUF6633 family protein [Prevotella sp. oral taxon 472]
MPKTTPAQPLAKACLARYGDRENFMCLFNPDRQVEFGEHPDRCHFGSAPTLGTLRQAYGKNMPTSWLVPQLLNLSEYCGCKNKLTDAQLEECARVIASEYSYLKTTELMLFFSRFKAGRYGRFYGNVDPMVITSALAVFRGERSESIARYDHEEMKKERETRASEAISYEVYIKLKQLRMLNCASIALKSCRLHNLSLIGIEYVKTKKKQQI